MSSNANVLRLSEVGSSRVEVGSGDFSVLIREVEILLGLVMVSEVPASSLPWAPVAPLEAPGLLLICVIASEVLLVLEEVFRSECVSGT
jgi:hypothetical protein